ncbi:MAG: glycoside hydrolase family protein [Plesiomonas shigelloides]
MSTKTRIAVATLSLSAAAFAGLVTHEGWTEKAIIPVKGDVPTVGPGLTKRPDGSPVQMGDTIKPIEGIKRSLSHIQKDEAGIKACVTAPLTQYEYDAFVSLTYNIGVASFCKSTLMRVLNSGQYQAACEQILRWDKFKGKPLRGLTFRRQREYQQCMGQL